MTTTIYPKQNPWNEEQVEALVLLIVQRGSDIEFITKRHNEQFGLKRTKKAVEQQIRRLRDVFTYQRYKGAWQLMEQHSEKFIKEEPPKTKQEQRIAELEAQVRELIAAAKQSPTWGMQQELS